MYPDGDLNELALRKVALRQRILLRRRECVARATRLARPLEKIDDLVARWRRISPLAKVAAVPAAMLFKRMLFPRVKILSSLLRWAPLAFKVFRGFKTAR
jgi:hypothetical protein